ncbi:hypothetical protein TWF694_010848 [Orbilia ellipsospora]|uniref:SEC7 domain-containing protein n=1 Tax=Orbilia ellipsospora TaxID=2528407 RepID=A0AAV9X788_9PEZI
MDFSTSTSSLHHPHQHHHHQHHHNHSPSPASSRSRAVSSHKLSAAAPLQIHRSASASALIASGSGSRGALSSNSQGPSDPRSKKSIASSSSSTAAPPPPVPNIPSFHLRNTNNQAFFSSGAPSNSFAGSRPGSAKLTIDTSLSNSYLRQQQQPQQNRSVSDTPYLTANQYQSSSSRRGLAAGDGYLTASKGTPTDRHELVAPSDTGFRNSLVDNLLLDFDKLGQDFSCDPVFDKFLDPFYSDTLNAQGDTYAYQDQDYAPSRLPTSYHQRKRSESNPVLPHRFYETQRSPKEPYLEEEEDVFEHNGTLVYTSDGRFITTPPQSRRGAPPSRQQSYTFEPFSDAAPTPRISNRSRAREPELPRQPNHLQRKRSTRSNKSLRRATDTMAEQAPLPTIPSEAHSSEPLASVPAKQASKPGFFRRVFGGGVTVAPRSSSISQTQPHTEENARPVEGIKRHASVSANPVSHVPDQIPPRTPQLVTKKSSGFFRRRKRSESEHEPVPDLPKAITSQINDTEITHSSHPPGTGSSSRPETAPSRSQSRSQPARHEREISDASILPNVVTSSPNNRNPTSLQSRRPTIRSIESELSNRIFPSKEADPNPDKITTAANISLDDVASNTQTTKDMYNPPKPDAATIQIQETTSAQPTKPTQFEGSFLRDDDSDSGTENTAAPASKLTAEAAASDIKPYSPGTDRTGSTGDVFYDAASSAGRNNSITEHKTESATTMPVVVLPQPDDEDTQRTEEAMPRPNKTPKSNEEEFEGQPSAEEKDAARKLFEGDEEFLPKIKAAAFLGEAGAPSGRIRSAYMSMFDWTSINILVAFRGLCEKLLLKAETQQVDRIVSAVAKRWCECNPNHGFKDADVVHTIIYSILLVNTDLHMADLQSSQRMTKAQFVKNTLATIKRGLDTDENENPRDIARCQTPYELDEPSDELHHHVPVLSKRLSFIRAPNAVHRFFDDNSTENFPHGSLDGNGTGGENGGPLINAPFLGNIKQWEYTLEAILKEFYSSIRAVALPLHGVTNSDRSPDSMVAPSTLGKELRRTNSTVSKAPSESSMSLRMDRYGGSFGSSIGNSSTTRLGSKWKSNRSRPRLYPGSFAGSSRTSFDDRLWSPSASSTWSKYSLDKTATTMMSTDSLGSGFGQGDYMQSIGFANALSTAIIREETGNNGFGSDDGEQSIQPTVLDDDIDELALYGAPWAKEGMIKHKHHLEATDKRAKNRGWVECFAVVEKGWMRLFLFPSDKRKITQGIVGGGNWMENAESIGSFMLRQTLASALPPPGYSRSRPHVFALSLPNGAVHLFQCGTADIVKEWVGTANYWSARLSKEPLVGGVSNIEYGWNNCIDLDAFAQTQSPPSTSQHQPRPSFQGSMRSSIDHHGVRARLPGDKAVIADWSPPAQSMFASPLNESDQHKALESYVKNIEEELQKHNELRSAMLLAFTPRHPNYNKAMNNWERKSSYLLKEIVKFRTYIDALSSATVNKDRIMKEKEQRAMELAMDKMDVSEKSAETILPPDTSIEAQ